MSELVPPPTTPPRRFKRKLTTFLAQEMLYEFAVAQLDPERRQAVEEFVAGDRECQTLLEGIHGSLEFVERLSRTTLKPEALAHLRESENVISLSRRYSKWGSWPDSMRWSIVAIAVSACVAASVAVVPWQKISFGTAAKGPDTVEVAKIPNDSPEQLKNLQEANEADPTQVEGSGDEADAADAGSGDNDEMAAAGDQKLSPAQQAKLEKEAKIAQEKEAQAAKAGERAQAEAQKAAETASLQKAELERTRSKLSQEVAGSIPEPGTSESAAAPTTAPAALAEAPAPFRGAPLLLRREPLPMVARLTSHLLTPTPGFVPVIASAPPRVVADNHDVEARLVAKAKAAAELEAATNAARKVDSRVGATIDPVSTEPEAHDVAMAPHDVDQRKLAPGAAQAGAPAGQHEVAAGSGDESASGDAADVPAPTGAVAAAPPVAASSGETTGKKDGKPAGFVYRAFMTLDDLDTLGPKITQLVQELGGIKAGEVELGWKKGNSVRYYHFSIPEDNQEKLLEQLQTYGPVRISKDPHPRIMPKGQVRFILWVEASKPH